MPYRIIEECSMCYICVQECPLDAIRDEDIIMVIDQNKCDECGVCYDVCPEGAVVKV